MYTEEDFIRERDNIYRKYNGALDCLKSLEAEEEKKERDFPQYQDYVAEMKKSYFIERYHNAEEEFQKAKKERIEFWKKCGIPYPE